MSHSEFPGGISAVAPTLLGGGQSFFAERQTNNVKSEQKLVHRHETDEEQQEQEREAETPESKDEAELKKEAEFEPTYDLSKGVEHHTHVGLLLDVKL